MRRRARSEEPPSGYCSGNDDEWKPTMFGANTHLTSAILRGGWYRDGGMPSRASRRLSTDTGPENTSPWRVRPRSEGREAYERGIRILGTVQRASVHHRCPITGTGIAPWSMGLSAGGSQRRQSSIGRQRSNSAPHVRSSTPTVGALMADRPEGIWGDLPDRRERKQAPGGTVHHTTSSIQTVGGTMQSPEGRT